MGLDITRIGQPRPLGSSAGRAVCEITTTRLPLGRRGDKWFTIFGHQLTGSLRALHDRTETITVTCDPREYPNWLLLVDLAILRTNEKEEAVYID
jgi:hypothetical protein